MLPPLLHAVTWLECAVVWAAAALLFTFPAKGGADVWPWVTPPYHARYIGAVYTAALVPLLVAAVTGRWSPGRVVLVMIFVFTTVILAVMVPYADRFEFDRPGTWVFWALYLFLPVNSAAHLWALRARPVPGTTPAGPAPRTLLAATGLALGVYGAALLVSPDWAAGFWPWEVDAFHGRIYAATFLTPAAGCLVTAGRASPTERATVGATLVTLGLVAIVGLFITSAGLPEARRADVDRGTSAFLALHAGVAAAGTAELMTGRRPAPRTIPQGFSG